MEKKSIVTLKEKELVKVVGGKKIQKANWRYTGWLKMTWRDIFK